MSFDEVDKLFSSCENLLKTSNFKGIQSLELEAIFVRYVNVRIYACYQLYIKNTIIKKTEQTKSTAIINYMTHHINRKIDIDYSDLKALLNRFDSKLGQELDKTIGYKPKGKNQDEFLSELKSQYDRIISDRHKIAHKTVDNLQIGSLTELKEAHNKAKIILQNVAKLLFSIR